MPLLNHASPLSHQMEVGPRVHFVLFLELLGARVRVLSTPFPLLLGFLLFVRQGLFGGDCLFRRHGKVVGTDCPDMDAKYLIQAFDALKQSDIVLGPAFDGGYTLIGLKAPHPELFSGIEWGTDNVLSTTL